ncbi:putative aminoadipate reductase [Mycena amicta]|nr:putative aminoadipate reductase [Mycena amicta]
MALGSISLHGNETLMSSFTFHPESATWPISDVVPFNAKHNPDAPFYVFAKPEPSEDIVTIKYLEFARAAERAAHLLRPNREGLEDEVVAIIALSDGIVYQAAMVGLFLAGLVPFPISPRNSPAAVVQLLKKTNCHRILATGVTLAPLLAGIHKELAQEDPPYGLAVQEMPSLDQLYPYLGEETQNHEATPYPRRSTPVDLDLIASYLHSSGSTGFPKAIPQTHRIITHWVSFTAVTDVRKHFGQPVASMHCPGFHLAGFYTQFLHPIYGGITVAMYPPSATAPHLLPVMPTPDNVLYHAKRTKSKSMMGFPAFAIQWAKSPEDIETLRSIGHIGISGGAIPQKVGDVLHAAGVNICTLYAATEFGGISHFIRRPEDQDLWEYAEMGNLHNLRWEPQGDGTFEMQILRSDGHHLCVENLADVPGYATSDLWVPHPEKPHLWKIVGRVDDVIVHSIAEKTVPAPMENIVMSNPMVSGTIMFGRDRDRAGILIEPAPGLSIDVNDAEQVAALRNKFWPLIEEANAVAPSFSRIYKEMILFASADKPLPRAGKGSVLRKATLELYAPEIDAIYDSVAQNSADSDTVKAPEVWDAEGVRAWLFQLAQDLTSKAKSESESSTAMLSPDVDLFTQGFDSLSATLLRLRIVAALRASFDPAVQKSVTAVEQNIVYAHPTVSKLATFIEKSITDASAGVPQKSPDQAAADSDTPTKSTISALIEKYSVDFPLASRRLGLPPHEHVVLLTGSSGSLGSHILAVLLADPRVHKVYAFNRPSITAGLERHEAAFKERGLDVELLTSVETGTQAKVTFIEGQTHLRHLGVEPEVYVEILSHVTVIIHNAWTLDFNLGVNAYEPHLEGTRNLLQLAAQTKHNAKFVFTSSVSSALGWDSATRGPCPERVLELELGEIDVGVGGSTGYGQSKFVAEQIIAKSGIDANILRIGQICGGPPTGVWSTNDWFPILVKTSVGLKALPKAEGVVSWIDFTVASQAVVDAALATNSPNAATAVFNLVHPRPVAWNDIVGALHAVLEKTQIVDFSDWYQALANAASSADQDTARNLPGIKLLEFFKNLARASEKSTSKANREFGMANFETEMMQGVNFALRDAHPLSDEHVVRWVSYWKAAGFL